MGRGMIAALLAACALAVPVSAETPDAPYAGQQSRAIKALSDEDIAALRAGNGMGLAKAAELNGYPGPAHVLALADRLQLTAAQRQEVAAIHARMSTGARPLGEAVIAHEQALDQLFAKGVATPDSLGAETAAIGELEGRLRAVHLAAHLSTRALLSPEQIALYQQLRGYGEEMPAMHHHPHG
jgi:Spy/CpxP family protein refolding chaperone